MKKTSDQARLESDVFFVGYRANARERETHGVSSGAARCSFTFERRVNEEFARKFRILRGSRMAFRVALLIVNPADRLGNAYAYSSLSRRSPYELKRQVTVVSKLPLLPVFLIRMAHFNAPCLDAPASPALYAIPAPHT